jgi:lipopolysaccharide export system permease protein
MASILFLAPADLGEAVLATGALEHVLQPGDALTLVCEASALALYRGAPGLEAVHELTPGQGFGPWVELALGHVGRPFDLLLDLRRAPAGYAIHARRRIVRRAPERLQHFVEEWSALLDAERPLAPKLWIDAKARETANEVAAPGPLLVITPGGANAAKLWPAERFAAVARRLAGGPLAGAAIVVLGSEPETPLTRAIITSLDADGLTARDARIDLVAAAALLERATLCIGNDNALTHIAAAVGAATLTLFGPTDERVRAPYGPRARTLRAVGLEEIAASGDGATAMAAIGIDAVEAAALEALQAGGLR